MSLRVWAHHMAMDRYVPRVTGGACTASGIPDNRPLVLMFGENIIRFTSRAESYLYHSSIFSIGDAF